MDGTRILLAAHRGDRKNCPENTMPAFKSAYEAGVDMIETDIHITRDGELVLIHDRSVCRTTGVERFVTDMTLDEVKALDAGSWFSNEFERVKVPTVREFMEWVVPTNLLVNWELKDYPAEVGVETAHDSVDKLLMLIREYGMESRSMLNSFSRQVLEYAHKQAPELPVHGQGIHKCCHSNDVSEISEEELFDWCCLYPEEAGKNPVDYQGNFDYCIRHGIHPCVCIPDEVEHYMKAIQYGCKMFTSNDIYEADRILRELKVRGV